MMAEHAERLGQQDGMQGSATANTLLIVDDEENILRSLKRLFRPEGYRILTAGSADEALEVMAREDAAVILSDQRMRGKTGSELFAQLKETHPGTIRIIMSGYTDLESITHAVNDGAIFKFLLKPWDDDKLKNHIREAFAIHSLQSDNLELNRRIEETNLRLKALLLENQQALESHQHALGAFQELLESVAVPVLGFDPQGFLSFYNRRASEELTGLVLGESYKTVMHAAMQTCADNDQFHAWSGQVHGDHCQGWMCRYRVQGEINGYVLTLSR